MASQSHRVVYCLYATYGGFAGSSAKLAADWLRGEPPFEGVLAVNNSGTDSSLYPYEFMSIVQYYLDIASCLFCFHSCPSVMFFVDKHTASISTSLL